MTIWALPVRTLFPLSFSSSNRMQCIRFKCRFSIVDISRSTVHTSLLSPFYFRVFSCAFAFYSPILNRIVDIQFMANMLTQTSSCAQTTTVHAKNWIGCHLVVWHQWICIAEHEKKKRSACFHIRTILGSRHIRTVVCSLPPTASQHGTLLCSHQPNQSTKTKLFD